jgi:hypothetical protein
MRRLLDGTSNCRLPLLPRGAARVQDRDQTNHIRVHHRVRHIDGMPHVESSDAGSRAGPKPLANSVACGCGASPMAPCAQGGRRSLHRHVLARRRRPGRGHAAAYRLEEDLSIRGWPLAPVRHECDAFRRVVALRRWGSARVVGRPHSPQFARALRAHLTRQQAGGCGSSTRHHV